MAGAAAIIAWSGGLCFIMFYAFKLFHILRVPRDMELQGLDLHKHNEPAYPGSAWEEGEKGPYSSSAITESLMGGLVGGSRKVNNTNGKKKKVS